MMTRTGSALRLVRKLLRVVLMSASTRSRPGATRRTSSPVTRTSHPSDADRNDGDLEVLPEDGPASTRLPVLAHPIHGGPMMEVPWES
jgi:hypothetical protein